MFLRGIAYRNDTPPPNSGWCVGRFSPPGVLTLFLSSYHYHRVSVFRFFQFLFFPLLRLPCWLAVLRPSRRSRPLTLFFPSFSSTGFATAGLLITPFSTSIFDSDLDFHDDYSFHHQYSQPLRFSTPAVKHFKPYKSAFVTGLHSTERPRNLRAAHLLRPNSLTSGSRPLSP